MTLERKFTVLIGLLSLTVAVSLGGAVWTVSLLEREAASPLAESSAQLREAGEALLLAEALRRRLDEARGVRTRADERMGEIERALRRLGEATAGLGDRPEASRLAETMARAQSSVREWMVRPAEPSRHEAATGAVAAHAAALATVEAAALARGDLAMERVRGVRAGVLMFQGLAVITAVAAALTAMLLHRRWIVTPVERLRAATERLATGDLEHRAPEEGTDELALLGREVNQMTARVRRMQAEAVERERFAAIGQVVRRLTHNIRNPLAGIRGLAEMSRAEPDASETVRDAQERIIETVDRFDRWLTDFLRATAPNEVTPRESDARRWLASSLRAIEPLARAAQVRLIVESEDAPERARFDPVHMEQALVALATNAIEASPRGGVVRVSAATEPNAWVLTVEDDGPGVPEELAERIFEPEYSTKSGGHGIGLAAARWIVRSHGGTIGLQPRGRGAGACFVIRLPLAEASDHHASEQGEAES